MELVLPMYNVHPYFLLKYLGKKCALYVTKGSKYLPELTEPVDSRDTTISQKIFSNNSINENTTCLVKLQVESVQ